MPEITPPVPDPAIRPKTAAEMAAEGEREQPVQQDHTHPDDVAIESDPQFANNGD